MRLLLVSFAVFAIAVHAGCGEPKSNEMLTVEETDGIIFNDVGVAKFPTPNGWTPNRSNDNTVVVLLRSNANRENPDQLISIDIGTPDSPDVEASADGFAKKFGGVVSSFSFTVDGESAYRVSIPPNYEQMVPRDCIVVHHNGKACFLIAGSKSKDDIWPTLEEIAHSWKWK